MNPKDLVGAKKASLRYVPPAGAIESSGPHEDGALKYGPFNWRETPVEMVTYLEAIDRHLAALKDGQDYAEDSGYSHIGHIIAGANIIADAKAHGTLIDNRFTKGPAAKMLRERDKSTGAVLPEPVAIGYPTTPEEAGITEEDVDRMAQDLASLELCVCHTPGIPLGEEHIKRVGSPPYPRFDLCVCPPERARVHNHLLTCPHYYSDFDTSMWDLPEPYRDVGGEG